jgi:hypothetical protein
VATRFDSRDDNFLASIQLAALRISLRKYEPVTQDNRHQVIWPE